MFDEYLTTLHGLTSTHKRSSYMSTKELRTYRHARLGAPSCFPDCNRWSVAQESVDFLAYETGKTKLNSRVQGLVRRNMSR